MGQAVQGVQIAQAYLLDRSKLDQGLEYQFQT